MEQDSSLKNRAGLKNRMSRGILILISFFCITFACNAQTTPKYDKIFAYSEGLAVVQKGEKFGYVDEAGREIIPVKYDATGAFNEGMARVKLNEKWGFIDKTGKEVIPLKYKGAGDFSFDYALVKLGDKFYMINQKGEEFGQKLLDDRELKLLRIEVNDKIGYFNITTYKLITPIKYDKANIFSDEGIALVQIGDKIGLIDKTGKEITPIKYLKIFDFSYGLARVAIDIGMMSFAFNDVVDFSYCYIDNTGKEISEHHYDSAEDFTEEGLACVGSYIDTNSNQHFGFINKTGKEVIPLKYDKAENFKNGLAKVKLGNEEFYIDKNGNRTDKK